MFKSIRETSRNTSPLDSSLSHANSHLLSPFEVFFLSPTDIPLYSSLDRNAHASDMPYARFAKETLQKEGRFAKPKRTFAHAGGVITSNKEEAVAKYLKRRLQAPSNCQNMQSDQHAVVKSAEKKNKKKKKAQKREKANVRASQIARTRGNVTAPDKNDRHDENGVKHDKKGG